MRHRVPAFFAILAVAVSAAAGANAAETSRAEYRDAVEPICKKNTEANERILDGVRGEVQKGQLKPAAVQLAKAARALKGTIAELRAVPKPRADKARLESWLGIVKEESELFAAAAKKLKAGDKTDAQRTIVELTNQANRANREVIPFGFRYCLLEPSRFT